VVAQIDVKPSYGLTDAEIANMLQASFTYAKADADARVLMEARTDAARLVEAIRAAIKVDGVLLQAAEITSIEAAIRALQMVAGEKSASDIKTNIDNLSRLTEDFAAKRMDNSVAVAFTGKTMTQIDTQQNL
jgi:molecular chaperone HscA